MTVRLSEQVVSFAGELAPESRRRLKAALKGLEAWKGDIRQLEGPLSGYHRLRAGGFRVIFKSRGSAADCVFIERRSIVYEVFETQLREKLLEGRTE